MIATNQSLVQVPDVQRAKGLEVLGIGALHMKLQLIGLGIILGIEGFTDFGNPLVSILVEVAVHRLSRPEGDVVEVNHVILDAAINQSSQLSIADGQRLFKEIGGTIIMQHHRGLLLG